MTQSLLRFTTIAKRPSLRLLEAPSGISTVTLRVLVGKSASVPLRGIGKKYSTAVNKCSAVNPHNESNGATMSASNSTLPSPSQSITVKEPACTIVLMGMPLVFSPRRIAARYSLFKGKP